MFKLFINATIFISGLVASVICHAQYGAITTATADSGRATVEPSEAPVLNPASIPFTKGYFITSNYAFLQNAQAFTASLTDNLPDTLVPASAIYNQVNGTSGLINRNFSTQDLRLEIANFARKNSTIGFVVRNRTDILFNQQYRQLNMGMGGIYAFNSDVGLALVLDNLFTPDFSVPKEQRLTPSVAAGLNYNYQKIMRFRLDVETASNESLNLPSIAGGLEMHWNQWAIFRLGTRKILESNTDEYGAGIGFSGPKFALHYGYLMSPQNDSLTRHAVDLGIPIW